MQGFEGSEKRLDFQVVKEPLDTLCVATHNKIEREWPDRFDDCGRLPVILRSLLLVSHNTHRSMRYLVADTPEDHARRPEFAASLPPLIRTLVDALCSLVYLLEDPPARSLMFSRGGWREMKESFARYEDKFGEAEEWQSWFASYRDLLELEMRDLGISEEENQKPSKVRYWPIPSQMTRDTELKPANREFLTHLDAWFYRLLSSASHQSGPGLAARAAGLLEGPDGEAERLRHLAGLKSNGMFTATTLLLAIVSEVLAVESFGLTERARFIWGVLIEYWEEARELYDTRYQRLLDEAAN